MAYTAKLREFPGLPADYIATAEKRFRDTLEKELGDSLELVLKAYSTAVESGADKTHESSEEFQRRGLRYADASEKPSPHP